ncbi:hypothetical protein K493DRAFT_347724 [Basidiobolus meristosporus CBS 931.73]|uniref:Uncharacterized protein n=1 Tax=Basidiobolus meristosporus CBS 931.73 TaxID=1314790 RepID=A0A1Y1YS83_9FUNG|nr:hypothetical protein K493DRAFT_347724 [Basidiobolus meristosporus CBS 931.73]|eukprot:ORY00684.1 hypothetical protein K493DRAFT_347724 [Basidiobolus meristosporus CBS 931.73]
MRHLLAVVWLVASAHGSIMIPIKGPLSRSYPALTAFKIRYIQQEPNDDGHESITRQPFQIYNIQESDPVKINEVEETRLKASADHDGPPHMNLSANASDTQSTPSRPATSVHSSTNKPTATARAHVLSSPTQNQPTRTSAEAHWTSSFSTSFSTAYSYSHSHSQPNKPTPYLPHRVVNPYHYALRW